MFNSCESFCLRLHFLSMKHKPIIYPSAVSFFSPGRRAKALSTFSFALALALLTCGVDNMIQHGHLDGHNGDGWRMGLPWISQTWTSSHSQGWRGRHSGRPNEGQLSSTVCWCSVSRWSLLQPIRVGVVFEFQYP